MANNKSKVCAAKTRAGQPCHQSRTAGSKFCLMHVPGMAKRIGSRGGKRRSLLGRLLGDEEKKFEAPRTIEDTITVLGQLLTQAHRGELPVRIASTCSDICSKIANAIELREFGEKLRQLAKHVGIDDPFDIIVGEGHLNQKRLQ
jgi:hypothetical protein